MAGQYADADIHAHLAPESTQFVKDMSIVQEPYKHQLEGLLLANVMPCFDSPYGYLRAKACWVAGQYADIDFAEGAGQGQAFTSLFNKVVNAFQDPDLPVRPDCCTAIC